MNNRRLNLMQLHRLAEPKLERVSKENIPAPCSNFGGGFLFISQSALTGESEPVEKFQAVKATDKNINVSDLDNICLLGTNVISGTATAVVVGTGDSTYFGSMAVSLVGQRAQTSFEKGLNSVSWLLIRFMMVMVPIVFFINEITKCDWLEALL